MVSAKTIFSVDLRALAAFRIALGTLLIIDIASRWFDTNAFYSDSGLLPRGAFLEHFANRFHFSLYFMNGLDAWTYLLLAITVVLGGLVIIGYRSRVCIILAWILLISLHNRNPMILNAGDVLFRMLFFWGMFLPLGARYSVDASLNNSKEIKDNQYFSAASVALIFQVFYIYWTTVALKTGKEWLPDGTASYYALSLEHLTTGFGEWLSQHHEFLRVSTYAVIAIEAVGPLFLISPFFYAPLRIVAVFVLAGMHISFDFTMRIGLFPWVDATLLLALLPTNFWDYLTSKWWRAGQLRIYYDGDCGFCKKMTLLIRTFLLPQTTLVAQAQSDEERAADLERENSWIVVDHIGKAHFRFSGIIAVARHSPVTAWFARPLPLELGCPIGDRLYNLVAQNRRRMSFLTAWLKYRPLEAKRPGRFITTMILLLTAYVGFWNLKNIPALNIQMHAPLKKIASVLRLDQKWNMFAPYPLKDDGWYVIPGELRDGTKVDVFRDLETAATWDKPDRIADKYRNARWRKYMMNIWQKKKKKHRLYYGKYLCRRWNRDRSGDRKLSKFEIFFMLEKTPPPGQPATIDKRRIWRHNCFAKKSATKSL